jgi:hypothetical protein
MMVWRVVGRNNVGGICLNLPRSCSFTRSSSLYMTSAVVASFLSFRLSLSLRGVATLVVADGLWRVRAGRKSDEGGGGKTRVRFERVRQREQGRGRLAWVQLSLDVSWGGFE